MPDDTTLPFFAYGRVKPAEIGFHRVAPKLRSEPKDARVSGRLYVRDGIPLLEEGGDEFVLGSLLEFSDKEAESAYNAIAAIEPRRQYEGKTVLAVIKNEEVRANALI